MMETSNLCLEKALSNYEALAMPTKNQTTNREYVIIKELFGENYTIREAGIISQIYEEISKLYYNLFSKEKETLVISINTYLNNGNQTSAVADKALRTLINGLNLMEVNQDGAANTSNETAGATDESWDMETDYLFMPLNFPPQVFNEPTSNNTSSMYEEATEESCPIQDTELSETNYDLKNTEDEKDANWKKNEQYLMKFLKLPEYEEKMKHAGLACIVNEHRLSRQTIRELSPDAISIITELFSNK